MAAICIIIVDDIGFSKEQILNKSIVITNVNNSGLASECAYSVPLIRKSHLKLLSCCLQSSRANNWQAVCIWYHPHT